jgi:hypothetical protein
VLDASRDIGVKGDIDNENNEDGVLDIVHGSCL